jgi:hypothetical protein
MRTILLVSLIGIAIVIFAITFVLHASRNTASAPTSSAPVSVPSTEESVDTNISLAPPSAANPSVQTMATHSSLPAPVYAGCELDLTFAVAGGDLNTAGTMQYVLASKNLGNTTCMSPSISVYYANDETYVSSTPPATADGYYWRLPDLAPGAEYDVALVSDRTAPLASGAVVNEACLSANNGADSCNNASVNVPSSETAPSAQAAVVAPTSFPNPADKEIGVWVWTPVDQMTGAEMQQTVNEAAANGFNAIYLTVDDYLDIVALPDGPDKEQELSQYNQSLENLITLGAQKGISVDAESGWRDWAEAGNTTNAIRIMTFVTAFNESHAEKFRGIQYDIEPYLLPEYQTDQSGILTDYVTLIESVVDQDETDELPLTIIVPDFYTATQQWTPEITINDTTDYTYNQIVRLLNTLPGSRIIVMAYRNSPSGPNGSIALSIPEIQYADSSHVKVLIAQETGPVTPSYVTFSGLSRNDLFAAIAVIDQSFESDTSFGGVAIDYLNPFLSLP